ncbi:hypothetical protein DBR06_SOUSAS3010041, partial [Sousa chinensis]
SFHTLPNISELNLCDVP